MNSLDIRSCYPEGKKAGENLCVAYNYQYEVPTKIARLFHIYGPGMNLNDGRMIMDFVSDVVNKRNIQIKSDGLDKRVLCYISDATVALFLILLKGKLGEAYNLADNREEISVKDLAELLVSLYPQLNLKIEYSQNSGETLQRLVRKSFPDISKIRNLGWEPKTTLKEGLLRTVKSYEKGCPICGRPIQNAGKFWKVKQNE